MISRNRIVHYAVQLKLIKILNINCNLKIKNVKKKEIGLFAIFESMSDAPCNMTEIRDKECKIMLDAG